VRESPRISGLSANAAERRIEFARVITAPYLEAEKGVATPGSHARTYNRTPRVRAPSGGGFMAFQRGKLEITYCNWARLAYC